jgi:CubicO group peptidase (beta-lactamase class C family)
MLLVEEGKIALDDSIRKYFPEAPASWMDVTIRRLLTHTAGVAGEGQETLDYQRDYTDDQLAKNAFETPLKFAPGSRWSYSNTGYILLGALVKRVSGKFYGDILQERVFGPLGMKTARVISDQDIVKNRAAGYELVKGEMKNQLFVSKSLNATADGSLYMALPDYVAWDRGLREGKVLKPESWKQVYTPVTLASGKTYPYGFGWAVEQVAGQTLYQHGGSWQGFRAMLARYQGSQVTVVVLANVNTANVENLAEQVAGLYDPSLKKPEPKPTGEKDAKAEARLRELVKLAAAGKLSSRETIPASSFKGMEKYFQDQIAPLGALKTAALVERQEKGDDVVTTWDVEFEKLTGRATLQLAPDGKAVYLGIEKR